MDHESSQRPSYATKSRVVLESPCAGTELASMADHAEYLRRALRDSIGKDEAPIASHGLFAFSNVFDDANPDERNQCMHAGWAWIVTADRLVVYRDYGISPGMQLGIEVAQHYGVPVSYRQIGTNQNPHS